MFDKDKNGQISQDELMCVMQSLGMKPTEQEVQDIINEFDIDSKRNCTRVTSSMMSLASVCNVIHDVVMYVAA